MVWHGDECMKGDPVAGRGDVYVAVTAAPIDVGVLMEFVADRAAGCSVVFTGTVRDHSPGREGVSKLEYEAYAGVAEAKIAEIIDEAKHQWPILRVAAVHRTGSLDIGEAAVVVAVSSGHRVDAFPAARYLIDEIKARVPVWKKEHWPGGAEWVAGA